MPTKSPARPTPETPEPTPEIPLEELNGVGTQIAEKLREAGYTDLMELAVASPSDVAEAADIGTQVALKIIGRAPQGGRRQLRERRHRDGTAAQARPDLHQREVAR